MKFTHRFQVKASLTKVVDFHARSTSMKAITPPPIIIQEHYAPPRLKDGDEMAFTLWIGPLPVRWLAKIEAVTESGFVDRQLNGPFKTWVHQHTFVSIDEQTTDVVDEIEAEFKSNPFWGLIGLAMWLGMPILFAFRGWKTRRLLETA